MVGDAIRNIGGASAFNMYGGHVQIGGNLTITSFPSSGMYSLNVYVIVSLFNKKWSYDFNSFITNSLWDNMQADS